MRYALASVLVATAALTTAACGPTVSIHRAPDVRIAAGTPWAWGAVDRDGLTPAAGALAPTDDATRMMRDAIERELVAKGFPQVSLDSARLFVHFHVGQRVVTDTLPLREDPPNEVRAPGSWGAYGRPEELEGRIVQWDEGMLIIDAITKDGRIVAWRGVIAGEIPEGAVTRPEPAIREAVARLLRRFP